MGMTEQDTGIAGRLRAARMQQGLELGALARELKNPRGVLEAIEDGDWARLGAPVFARHLVGRYAHRLGVDVDLEEVTQALAAPVLTSHVPASRMGRFADFSARHLAYVGGTVLVVPLVYTLLTMTSGGPVEVRALDPVPLTVATAQGETAGGGATDIARAAPSPGASEPKGIAAAAVPVAPSPQPVIASLAGSIASNNRMLELRFSGDSWIEVIGRDGAPIERVLARQGEFRLFDVGAVGRVTIGNVDATDVRIDGSAVNLDPVRAANVARFALSSDGSIEAVSR